MSSGDPDSGAIELSASDVPVGAGAYAVKLPVFEGPLDLLLHLIRQNDVEITDIPIASIGAQYLAYLELMQELNLEIAGEYLVMAATLALIKSRMLLPSEEEEEEEGIDPRSELVARLLEYQRFKEVAEELSKRRLLGRDVFAAQETTKGRASSGQREIEVGLFELLEAFRQVLQGASTPHVHEVEVEVVTVRERMQAVMQALADAESLEFMQIFRSPDGGRPSRSVLVATFLAILELARLSALHVYQGLDAAGAPEGAIRLRRASAADDSAWAEHVSDWM